MVEMKEGALAIGFWSQPSSTFSKLPVLTINLTKNSLICGLYPRVPDETPYLDDPIDLEKAISSAVSLSVKRRLQILRKEFAIFTFKAVFDHFHFVVRKLWWLYLWHNSLTIRKTLSGVFGRIVKDLLAILKSIWRKNS